MTAIGLQFRSALNDYDQVATETLVAGSDTSPPVVTIAITTFNRPGLLVESVRSALQQRFDRPFEVIVLDNDPLSTTAESLLQALPELRDRPFRYLRNRENIGVFGNFNRCIQSARGEWVTILNDDDLLEPDCLATAFAEIDRDPSIHGLAMRKRWLDERAQPVASPSVRRRLAEKALRGYLFGGRRSRRIRAAQFMWGALLGNNGGFLFKKQAAIAVGGYYPEEYPSADYWFYARFASQHHLRQHRAIGAVIRKTGEQITTSSVLQQLQQGFRLQTALAGSQAPAWWRHFIPLIAARHRVEFRQSWNGTVSEEELAEGLGITLPPDRPRLVQFLRLLLRGY